MRKKTYIAYLSFALLIQSSASFAYLGGHIDTIDKDRAQISGAKKRTSRHENYSVQELVSDSIRIREFVSPSGIVFGVAWNGVSPPNLTQILGSYVGEYETALKNTPKIYGKRSQSIKGDKVIVEKWGHMRNLQGRAYDPSLIPQGVSPDDIK